MIPLSHYNWFGEPTLKEKIKDILMITWIVFLCPMIMIVTVGVVFWGCANLINTSQPSDVYHFNTHFAVKSSEKG